MLNTGDKFPNFQLQNQDGKTRTLADYNGQWVVFYVYPKDDTPGCTIQGKSFTATKDQFEKAGIKVVGLSADDVESHQNFCKKYSLAVELLADPQGTLLKATGIGQTDYAGTKYWDRSTFVVDPKGTVRKVYAKVKPQDHEKMLLEDIAKLR